MEVYSFLEGKDRGLGLGIREQGTANRGRAAGGAGVLALEQDLPFVFWKTYSAALAQSRSGPATPEEPHESCKES
jgi:hypothetical protein